MDSKVHRGGCTGSYEPFMDFMGSGHGSEQEGLGGVDSWSWRWPDGEKVPWSGSHGLCEPSPSLRPPSLVPIFTDAQKEVGYSLFWAPHH